MTLKRVKLYHNVKSVFKSKQTLYMTNVRDSIFSKNELFDHSNEWSNISLT